MANTVNRAKTRNGGRASNLLARLIPLPGAPVPHNTKARPPITVRPEKNDYGFTLTAEELTQTLAEYDITCLKKISTVGLRLAYDVLLDEGSRYEERLESLHPGENNYQDRLLSMQRVLARKYIVRDAIESEAKQRGAVL